MQLTLTEDLFTNGEYSLSYGDKVATFTIIDETLVAASGLGATIDRMILTIAVYDEAGEKTSEEFGNLIIGLGDSNVAVTSEDISLRGKLMTKDNMSKCSVELYE